MLARRIVGRLPIPENGDLASEDPYFAAAARFVRRTGGPITRTFLDALPPWPEEDVLIDSELVWVKSRATSGSALFHREAYPGRTGHAFGLANAEVDVEHITAALGPVALVYLEGELEPGAVPRLAPDLENAGGWTDRDSMRRRDAWLRARLADGTLRACSVEEGQLLHCGGDTFLRRRPADEPGFSLILRATLGSFRPAANLVRNVVFEGI